MKSLQMFRYIFSLFNESFPSSSRLIRRATEIARDHVRRYDRQKREQGKREREGTARETRNTNKLREAPRPLKERKRQKCEQARLPLCM